MTVRILVADVMAGLRSLPDESVNTCVTSPPYWGLRDYGVAGQIGLEPTMGDHLDVMVRVFEEVRRVLRKDGTCWINYGDCYAASPNGRSAADTKAAGTDDRTFRDKPFSTVGPIYDPKYATPRGEFTSADRQRRLDHGGRIVAGGYLKPKDLAMVPNRLAIALQDAGWWVRSEIIWHKTNPMPESIRDRPCTSHEKVWLLSKSERYFYDNQAVAEPAVSDHASGNGFVGRQGGAAYMPMSGGRGSENQWEPGGKRNLRNVWTLPIRPFPEAHFATFPPEIPERCIKAGCPEGGVVLDPFGGAGTTGLVADRLKRDAVLIELNPGYAEMARRRIEADAGMYAAVTVETLAPATCEAAE